MQGLENIKKRTFLSSFTFHTIPATTMWNCSITTDNNLARGSVRMRPTINELGLTRTIAFLYLIFILNFLSLEAICRRCRQHITELVAQPKMIPDPYQQQPISSAELQISPEASGPPAHLTELPNQRSSRLHTSSSLPHQWKQKAVLRHMTRPPRNR